MRSIFFAAVCATAVAAQSRMPGGYIVELAASPAGKRSADSHAEFLDALDKRASGKFETRQQYHHEIFNGIAVQLKTPEDLVDIASLPNVIAVHPLWIHPAPEPVSKRVVKEGDEKPLLGASVHQMTGVDAVHAAGIKGKGIRIAIVDSGVDYTHPALGGGFGPGFKIAGGTDLVGDAYDGGNTPVPDDDPMDCLGHGTHVSGIVGANPGNVYDVVGVAPEAEIYMYKVGGCRGGLGDDVLAAGIIRAVEEGADVISMSFGGTDGWSDSALAVVASRAAAQGIVVTASAGNAGDGGLVFSSVPAVAEGVISSGSVENTRVTVQTLVTNVEHAPIKYHSLGYPSAPGVLPPGLPETPIPVLALEPFPPGTPSADCQELPDDVPKDLSGLAIVLHGIDNMDCGVLELTQHRNPVIVLSYRNPWLLVNGVGAQVLISDEDGDWLAEQSKAGNLTIQFPGPLTEDPTGESSGLMNDFSSMGPGNRLEFYPSVSAPGGDIMSTYLDHMWLVQSGTSMSNPYTAGSAALILQAKGKQAAPMVRDLLQSTSQGLPSSHADGAAPQTLAYQGAGLINVNAAINFRSRISPAQLQLNDTTHWKGKHTITIFNDGPKSQTYTLAHVAAGTTVTKQADLPDLNLAPIALTASAASVAFSKKTVTVAAGKSATVGVTISVPTGIDARTLPILSGWITATSAAGDVVKTSYVGMAAPFHDAQTISTTARFDNGHDALPYIFGETSVQHGPDNYTIKDPSVWPTLYFGLSIPSSQVFVDVIDAKANVTPTIPHASKSKRTWSDWLPTVLPGAHRVATAYPIIAPIAVWNNLPRNAYPRKDRYQIALRDMANGTHLPLGQYKALLRALRPFGSPEKPEDYDVYVSEQFGWVE